MHIKWKYIISQGFGAGARISEKSEPEAELANYGCSETLVTQGSGF